MHNNDQLASKLKKYLKWKQSKKFYAEKLGTTEDVIEELLSYIKYEDDHNSQTNIVTKYEEDVIKGGCEITADVDKEIQSLDDLIKKCKIDTTKWNIVKYVQNYWGNVKNPHWQVKVWLSKTSEEQQFRDSFITFLSTYSPRLSKIDTPIYDETKNSGCLLINKQDAHYNRADVNGDDNIHKRFVNVYKKLYTIVKQATVSNNLDNVVYILGSDIFNSEFTGTTTKGTPQDNILTYHDAFERICNHEVEVIEMLLKHSRNVNVVFVPGNHDEYVGWHLVSWLKAYLGNDDRINFDICPKYRKYVSFGNSAMMFNHGDTIKPERLAAIFPIEYREDWSKYKYFYIFTGDKHSEISQDFNGIEFYRLSAFTNVSSKWEDKNGYIGRNPVATAFMIDEQHGITNILKQYL